MGFKSEAKLIPQSNPLASYQAFQEEIDEAWRRVMCSGRYILDREVAAFEKEFSAYHGVDFAIGTANGTDAIQVALRALGIGPGSAVVTVSHTALATGAAIVSTGATPVFVDVDTETYTIDPNALEQVIQRDRENRGSNGNRIKAIVPVHLYGHPADMAAICDIARRYELHVVEDCAQAHGASIDGQKVGTWGDLAAFSFYPTKNLGCFGDGGAVITHNEELAQRCNRLRQYGWNTQRRSLENGLNSRLDELQSAILRVKLRFLDEDNARRKIIASTYDEQLQELDLVRPTVKTPCLHVYHQYVICVDGRDELREFLSQRRIATSVHYAVPVHQHPSFSCPEYVGHPLHHTEKLAGKVLSLPMFPQLALDAANGVANAMSEWCSRKTNVAPSD